MGWDDFEPKNINVRNVLLITGDIMEASIIRVSSKGQIVIPVQWRKRMKIKEGEELLAIGEGDALLIKKIERSMIKKEFESTVAPIRRRIKKLGIKKGDVKRAIKKARET